MDGSRFHFGRHTLAPVLKLLKSAGHFTLKQNGAHGSSESETPLQLITTNYKFTTVVLLCCCWQGDPNVPATKTSIKADLKRPMILTLKQQDSIDTLSDIDIPDLPPDTKISQMPSQPFRVPMGCLDRHQSPPDRCKSRWKDLKY